MKRLRWMARETSKRSPAGVPVLRYGLCVGYWPCIDAPFIQLALGSRYYEVWYGLPSKHQPKEITQ